MFSILFLWKLMESWKKLPKSVGASTHTFKNHGFWSTHSTHTNEEPEYASLWKRQTYLRAEKFQILFHQCVVPRNLNSVWRTYCKKVLLTDGCKKKQKANDLNDMSSLPTVSAQWTEIQKKINKNVFLIWNDSPDKHDQNLPKKESTLKVMVSFLTLI